MALPRTSALAYWLYALGGVVMIASFFVEGGAANSGWTVVSAAVGPGDVRPDLVADRHGAASASRRRSSSVIDDHHHRPRARAGRHAVADAVLRVVAAGDGAVAAARLSGAAGGRGVPADGPRRRHQLLPAERAGPGRYSASGLCRRRQSAAVAAPVLVPRAPGGLRPHPAGDGHRRGGDRQQHAAAAVGLRADGRRRCCSSASCRCWCGRTTCS